MRSPSLFQGSSDMNEGKYEGWHRILLLKISNQIKIYETNETCKPSLRQHSVNVPQQKAQKNYSHVGPLKEMLMFQCKTLCAWLCFYTRTGLDAISLAKEMIHSLLL